MLFVFSFSPLKNMATTQKKEMEVSMKDDKWQIIQQIQFIQESIEDECQEYLYYVPHANKCIYERIKNASVTLLHNALRLFRNQTPIIKTKAVPLTIERTRDLMFKIYQTILTPDFPVHKEDTIKAVMRGEFLLNPNELLQLYPTNEKEYYKNLSVLNDKH